MFSRTHPYLFFILVFTSLSTIALISMMVFFSILIDHSDDLDSGEHVGVIEVIGVIQDARQVIKDLKRFGESDTVKAIVVRVDSPGGGVGPSQEIYREIVKTSQKKKVIASMGAVAASGGYYIAAASDGIMANPGTITGSIGVIMGYTSFEKIFKKIGLTPVVIKSGEYKDTGSPVRQMTQKERDLLQGTVNQIHEQFVRDAAEGRGMEVDDMSMLADGRVFTGEEAVTLGLVDRIGNFEDSVEWAGRMAGIEGDISVIYAREDKFSVMELVFGESLNEMASRLSYRDYSPLYRYQPGK